MGRRGRPRSPSWGADSAGPGCAPDVATPCSGRPTTSARGAGARRARAARESRGARRAWRGHRRARRPPGPARAGSGARMRLPARARRRCLSLGLAELGGLGRRRGAGLWLRSALRSRAEGAPSCPDVRSPGLSAGGGEAGGLPPLGRGALKSSASCSPPFGRRPRRRRRRRRFPLAAPGSHKWAQRAHPGAGRPRHSPWRPLASASHQPRERSRAHSRAHAGSPRGAESPASRCQQGASGAPASVRALPASRARPQPTRENLSPLRPCSEDFLKAPLSYSFGVE